MTKEKFLELEPNSVRIIDIREDDEIIAIPSPNGAVHIPMQTFAAQIESGSIPKDKKIITVCRGGARCVALKGHLTKFGYESDYLEGGVMAL